MVLTTYSRLFLENATISFIYFSICWWIDSSFSWWVQSSSKLRWRQIPYLGMLQLQVRPWNQIRCEWTKAESKQVIIFWNDKQPHTQAGLDGPITVPLNCDRCCERGSFMDAITAEVKLKLGRLLLLLCCLCVFFSGKIPALHLVPCGCGLGKRHSNAFVTQQGGNCKRFLDNCAFVPLPGGYWASQEPNNTPESDLEQAPGSGSRAQPTVLNGCVTCRVFKSLYSLCGAVHGNEAELK